MNLPKLSIFILLALQFSHQAQACEILDWGSIKSAKMAIELKDQILEPLQGPKTMLETLSDRTCRLNKLEELAFAQTQLKKLRSWEKVQSQMRLFQIAMATAWKKEIETLLISGQVTESSLLSYYSELANELEAEVVQKQIIHFSKTLPEKRARELRTYTYSEVKLEWEQKIIEMKAIQNHLAKRWIQKNGCQFLPSQISDIELSGLQVLEAQAQLLCTQKEHILILQNLIKAKWANPKLKFKRALVVLERRGIFLKNTLSGHYFEKNSGNLFRPQDFQGEEVLAALKTLGIEQLANPHRKDAIIFYTQVFMPPIQLPQAPSHIVLPKRMEGEFFSIRLYDYIKLGVTKINEKANIQKLLGSHQFSYTEDGQLDLLEKTAKLSLTELMEELKKLNRVRSSVRIGVNPYQKLPLEQILSEFEKLHLKRGHVVSVGKDLLALPPYQSSVGLMTRKEYKDAIDSTILTFNKTRSEMSQYLKDHDGFKGNYARYWTKVSEDYNLLEKRSKDVPRRVIFQQQIDILKHSLRRLERLGAFDLLSAQSVTLEFTVKEKKGMQDLIPYLQNSERELESMMVSSMAVIPLISTVAITGLVKVPVVALFAALIGGGIETGRQVVEVTVDGTRKKISLKEIYQNTLIGTATANVAPYEKLRPLLLLGGSAMSAQGIVQEIEKGQLGVATYDAAVSGVFLGMSARSSLTKAPLKEVPKPTLPPSPGKPGTLNVEQKALLNFKKDEVIYLTELTAAEYNKISHLIPQTNTTSPAQKLIMEVVERRILTGRQKMQTNGKVVTVFEEETVKTPFWRAPIAHTQTQTTQAPVPAQLRGTSTTASKGHWDQKIVKDLSRVHIASQVWKNPLPENFKITESWIAHPQRNSTAATREEHIAERSLRENTSPKIATFTTFSDVLGTFEIVVAKDQHRRTYPPVTNPLFNPQNSTIIALRQGLGEAKDDRDAQDRMGILADAYEESDVEGAAQITELLRLSMEMKKIYMDVNYKRENFTETERVRISEIVTRVEALVKVNHLKWFRGKEFKYVQSFELDGGFIGISLAEVEGIKLSGLKKLNDLLTPGIFVGNTHGNAGLSGQDFQKLMDSGLVAKARSLSITLEYDGEVDLLKNFLKEKWPNIRSASFTLEGGEAGSDLENLLFGSGSSSLPNLTELNIVFSRQGNPFNMIWHNGERSLLARLEKFHLRLGGLTPDMYTEVHDWWDRYEYAFRRTGQIERSPRSFPQIIDFRKRN